jgi:hypothetical protein
MGDWPISISLWSDLSLSKVKFTPRQIRTAILNAKLDEEYYQGADYVPYPVQEYIRYGQCTNQL